MVSTDASEDIISRIIEDFKLCQEHLAYHKLITGEIVEKNVPKVREKIVRKGFSIKKGEGDCKKGCSRGECNEK
jgi:hypothetical protein